MNINIYIKYVKRVELMLKIKINPIKRINKKLR